MRDSTSILWRVAFCSWIATFMLGLTSGARGQTPIAPGASSTAANVPSTQPLVTRFKRYVIKDNDGFQGLVFLTGIMPIDWTVKGGVLWNPGVKGLVRVRWGDAQDVNGFDIYPSQHFRVEPNGPGSGRFQPGQVFGAFEIEPFPADQWEVIDRFIVQRYRPDLANATVLKKEKSPDVAKQANAQLIQTYPAPRYTAAAWAGTETLQYNMNGQTVQEMVSIIVKAIADRRFGGGYWAIDQASSRRAVDGNFDQLKTISALIFQSIQQNPAWQQKFDQLVQQNQQQQAAAQQRTFNAIENRIATQTQANDAQHASYWGHVADLNRQSENEADVQREVSPWQTSDGSTYKLPTAYGYAWSGADGTIIMNNDPQYNPNTDPTLPSTNWTAMQQTKN